MLNRKLPSAANTNIVHIFAKNHAALLGKINMFKDTVSRLDGARCDKEAAADPVFVQGYDLTRFDVADVFCIDRI